MAPKFIIEDNAEGLYETFSPCEAFSPHEVFSPCEIENVPELCE